VRGLREHSRDQAAHVRLRQGFGGQRATDDDIPGHGRIERRRHAHGEQPFWHRRNRALDHRGIAVSSAHDIAVRVQRQEKGAVTAIDFEHTRAGADIERFGHVFGEL
jgi:hypothetical protein